MHYCSLLLLVCLSMACRSKNGTASEGNRSDSAVANPAQAEPASPGRSSPDNFIIIPGERVGGVRATSTEASLKAFYGPEVVVRDTVYTGEGQFEIGTTVFKHTADQIQILWKDKTAFARPEIVFVRPDYDETGELRPGPAGKQVQWLLPGPADGGISVGTSLRTVEKINGRPFKLYGFGWDYGGLSAGWESGTLQAQDGNSYLSLQFGFGPQLSHTN